MEIETDEIVYIIDAVGDSAFVHPCGTYVSPNFNGTGIPVWCPTCHQLVGN